MSEFGDPGHTPDDVANQFMRELPLLRFLAVALGYHGATRKMFIKDWVPQGNWELHNPKQYQTFRRRINADPMRTIDWVPNA